MKNHPKEKREKDKKILKDRKKFKEWEIISNFIYLTKTSFIILKIYRGVEQSGSSSGS